MREEACSADTIIRDEDALREPYVREGEQTLTKIIDALKSGTDLSTVKNIASKKGREFVITPKERETNPLSDNIINYSLFANEYAKTGRANVRISDGCPYACGFCAFPEHNNERYELMSMDRRIEREFNAIRDSNTSKTRVPLRRV
jgi:radical SAM superfamily enzyme YgiQ (UPF0313 family)